MPLLDDVSPLPYRVNNVRTEDFNRRRAANETFDTILNGPTGSSSIPGVKVDPVKSADLNSILEQYKKQMASIASPVAAMTPDVLASRVATGAATSVGNIVQGIFGGPKATPAIGTKNYLTGKGDPALRSTAQGVARSMGWNDQQFQAWDALINAESSWNPTAQNPTSTAYGLGQFLNSTWSGVGGQKTSDPATQLQYMAQYIKNRYGDPVKALNWHASKNWY
jgi:hypothetical protein